MRRPIVMRRLPIALRITAVAAAALAASLLVISMIVRAELRRGELAQLDRTGKSRLDQTVEMVAAGEMPAKLPSPRDSTLMVQVIDRAGQVVSSTQNAGDLHLIAAPSTFEIGTPSPVRSAIVDGITARLFEQTVARPPDSVVVLVAAPLGGVHATVRTLTRQLWLFGPFIFGVSTIVVWLVARRALRPVDRLRAEVDAVMPQDLSARVSAPPVDDELGRLADTMNALLARIQDSSERQTRFVSDASHELRSPLASVRTRLEVGLRRPLETDWCDLATGVLAENVRMEHLVRDLLYLAGTDVGSGAGVTSPTSVDLEDVVMQEINNVRGVARVPIDASGVSAARVRGHRDHLRRVVANLLDNAQRHATSVVIVRVAVEGSEAVMRVHDDGEGIDEVDRERVFERFTRLDDARTRESGGSGLGLALVREIVTEHKGVIALEPLFPHGTAAVVRLPLRFTA